MQEGFASNYSNLVLQLHDSAQLIGGNLISYNDEKSLLEDFFKLIITFDPDIITGYNIDNFDFNYVFGRAKLHNVTGLKFSRND